MTSESKKPTTYFAPAERVDDGVIKELSKKLMDHDLFQVLLDIVPNLIMILNEQRQILYANKAFISFLGGNNLNEVLGLRPGEALGCIHADKNEAGCGTSEFCSNCGAVNSILQSQKGIPNMKECRITQKRNGLAMDLMVHSAPFQIVGQEVTIFSVSDISHEKRRKILENIFFHDILNIAGGIHSLTEVLFHLPESEMERYKNILRNATKNLLGEINSQKDLLAAEAGELKIELGELKSKELFEELTDLYVHHKLGKDKNIQIDPQSENVVFISDKRLVGRILGNMIKNALEASEEEQIITLSSQKQKDHILISVHNQGAMPLKVQQQVFQRSFTTKGEGRGLGTYSMKLLTENYLAGNIGFQSSEKEGTTFWVELPIKKARWDDV